MAAAFLFTGAAGTALAGDVAVDCSGTTPGAFTSITAALAALDLVGPHIITVSGPCTEDVHVAHRRDVTIQGADSQGVPVIGRVHVQFSTAVVLRRLIIRGNRLNVGHSYAHLQHCTVENSPGHDIIVSDLSMLVLGDTTVRNNGGRGILVVEGSQVTLEGGVNIENNGGTGIGGRGLRLEAWGPNVFRGNLAGVNLLFGSSAAFFGQNTFQDNVVFGVQVGLNSNATFFDGDDVTSVGTIIEGNGGPGVVVLASSSIAGALKVRNNGAGQAVDPFYVNSGVQIGTGSSALLEAGTEISSNLGPGILADPTASLYLSQIAITGNAAEGIKLQHLSAAHANPGTSISGNGGPGVACDTTSVLFGDLTGISPVQCAGVDRTPPDHRPSAAAAQPRLMGEPDDRRLEH